MEFKQNFTDAERKPLLRTYLNIVTYLNDYYVYRKKKDSHFSYELWSEELGFRSKASTRMICQGKRNMTDVFLKALIRHEKYTEEEQDYLQLLNFYQTSKSASLKKSILEKIIEKFDVTNSQKNIRNYIYFLSSIHIPVLQILISFEDFKATEKNLSQTLGLEEKSLRHYLRVLEELDLIQSISSESSEENYWISKNKLFRVPADVCDPAIALFHEQTLLEAQERIRLLSVHNKFRTLYFSLSQESFLDICETLNEVANRLKVQYCNNYIQGKKIFKFNFQLYPVTDLIQHDQN